jgi:hypothetical protein
MENIRFWFLASVLLLAACTNGPNKVEQSAKQVHMDTPFLQDYSIKYYLTDPAVQLLQVASDRNGAIRILSSDGLRKPHSGAFLYPGTIEPDNSYRPMADKKISSIGPTRISWSISILKQC